MCDHPQQGASLKAYSALTCIVAHLYPRLGSILLGDTYKMAQPTTFTKTITSRGASYQKTLCPQAEEVSPRQVSDQKNLY